MSVATVSPNETVASGGASVVGAATQHEATSDDSDSSYILLDGANSTLGFAEPTIPAGGIVTEARVRVRSAIATTGMTLDLGAGGESETQFVIWTTPTTSTAAIWPADAFNVADVKLAIEKREESANELRVYELYIDFIYAVELTVDITPIGTLPDTNLPLIEWDRTFDQAGGSPTHFEVKVFTDAVVTGGGFDPDTSTPVASSGVVASHATSYQIDGLDLDDNPLPNDDYHVHVRLAQTINGEQQWSEWDSEPFTIDVDLPAEPTIALVPQPACGRMRIDLDPRDQLCTNPEAETDTAGWTNNGLTTFERVTSLPTLAGLPSGVTTGFHAVGNGDNDRAEDSFAVENGKQYTVSAYVRLASLTATSVKLVVRNSANATVGGSDDFSTVGGGFARLSATITATETATWTLRAQEVGAGAADWHFTAVLIEQAATLGDYFEESTDAFQVQRSDDAGATWADIRTVDGGGRHDRSSDPLTTLLDWEAANGATVKYRGRSIHTFAGGDAFSDWVEDEDSWESTDAWLKHPTDPTLNAIVTVYSQPSERTAARVGVHNVLGRSDPVITSDKPGPKTGELVFDLSTAAEQAALDALLETLSPLLLQMPAEHHWPDRWLVFTGDHERSRIVDKLEVEDTHDSLPWTAVARPSGTLLAWPSATCP